MIIRTKFYFRLTIPCGYLLKHFTCWKNILKMWVKRSISASLLNVFWRGQELWEGCFPGRRRSPPCQLCFAWLVSVVTDDSADWRWKRVVAQSTRRSFSVPRGPFYMTVSSLAFSFSAAIRRLPLPSFLCAGIWVCRNVFVHPVVLWRKAAQLSWCTWRRYRGINWLLRVCGGARNGVIIHS